jgi:3-hydroxybutyryl-CoA dehydrogenase
MVIAVIATEDNKREFLKKPIKEDIEIIWIGEKRTFDGVEADGYMDLVYESLSVSHDVVKKPVFVNSVPRLGEGLPKNFIRINAWSGFLQRNVIEIAGDIAIRPGAEKILNNLGWQFKWVPDISGMIAPRIISMIINEAYHALGDEISTKEEIDVAMKLGTNYPCGPFEWSKKIGLRKIYNLLHELSKDDRRYLPAPLLEKEIGIILNELKN